MFMCARKLAAEYILFVAASVLLLTITTPAAFAQGSSEEHEAEGAAVEEMKSDEEMASVETGGYVSGEVVSVDARRKNFVIRESEYGGDLYLFSVNHDTTFTEADALSDLRPGDSVTVDYFMMGDNKVADNVILEERAAEEKVLPELEKVMSD